MSLSEAHTSSRSGVLKLLFEGLAVIDTDFMLDCTHATKLISTQHEDVMKSQDELSSGSRISWGPVTVQFSSVSPGASPATWLLT